jgi:hypothetical protein
MSEKVVHIYAPSLIGALARSTSGLVEVIGDLLDHVEALETTAAAEQARLTRLEAEVAALRARRRKPMPH